MAAVTSSPQRNGFFQQLKQVCVPLSRVALQPRDKTIVASEVLPLLESLISLWTTQARKDATILDDKLADYVFFPLSHLLRSGDRCPIRVIETIIRLLRELVQHGWKAKTSPELFGQLLVLLSSVVGSFPGQPKRDTPEETVVEGFRTLAALISIAQPAHVMGPDGKATQAFGDSVIFMLDGVTEGVAPSVQLEAVQCLRVVFTTVKQQGVLAQLLPGTVSALTKILAPPLANQTQKRVLLSCLEVLKLVLINVLGDLKVRALLPKPGSPGDVGGETTSQQESASGQGELTPAWLRATAAQVKIALSAVLKLRAHESEEIQFALYRLCIGLLDECHASLADCQSILVESAMMLEGEDTTRSRLETSLQDLVGVYAELGDSVQSALYSWITSLPRVMQSADERVKGLAIRSILRGSKLAAAMQMDSSTLNDALGDSLRESIITLIKGAKQPKIMDDVDTDVTTSTDLIKSQTELATYAPVLLHLESQKTARKEINSLIASIGSAAQQVKLATSMLTYLRDSEGVDQVASFWLAFELLKASYTESSELDDILDLSSLGESRHQEDAFRELYDFSASVLAAHSDSVESDWRIEAIALEVTAFAAARLNTDFRPELIDVLYPVTTFLGAQAPQLRKHAITTLNIIAAACGYDSVSDLIVDNADYMVNSISLRLNTFDISPASTKVLTMVVRLTGPRLIPFLDDVVAAIFAALDNYHGYPAFVEGLFSVLSEVVTQGVKSDVLLLEGSQSKIINHRKKRPQSQGIPGILETLDKRLRRAKRLREEEQEDNLLPKSHPKRPWLKNEPPSHPDSDANTASSLLDKLAPPPPSDDPNSPSSEPDPSTTVAPPPQTDDTNDQLGPPTTPTYTLLSQILSRTQHHLTSPSPTLRRALLDLIARVGPALAPRESDFLPLVHAVWPVALARLRDPEPFVRVAACGALVGLCRAAGDFLGSRFKSEWWGAGGLGAWVRGVRGEAMGVGKEGKKGREGREVKVGGLLGMGTGVGYGSGRGGGGGDHEGNGIVIPVGDGLREMTLVVRSSSTTAGGGGSGALGRFTQASQVWEAVLGLLAAVVTYVRVEDDMFDDILGLVVDVLPRHDELREALEVVNADAVWLAMYERGMILGRAGPAVDGFQFVPMRPKDVGIGVA